MGQRRYNAPARRGDRDNLTAPVGMTECALRYGEEGSVSRSLLGLVIVLMGAVLLVISVFADPIGIGVNEEYAFGWKQTLGTVVGVSLLVVGYLVWRAAQAPSSLRR
jgi:hypothetical protein